MVMKFAVVGVGGRGNGWCRRLQAHAETELVSIVDINARRVKSLQEKHGAKSGYTDMEEMLKHEKDLDAVVIATPHYLHSRFTVLAAENDLHVLCEKPMAITLQQCDEMIIACRKNAVKLGIGFQHRFERVYEYLHDAIRGAEGDLGSLGRITDIHMTARHYRGDFYYLASTPVDPATGVPAGQWRGRWVTEGAGILINQAVHDLDFWQWICGPFDSVAAYASTISKEHALIEVEDTVTAAFQLKSGALGTFVATSSNKKSADRRILIHGTEGYLDLVGNFVRMDTRYKSEEDYEVPFTSPPRHNLLENFLDAVQNDTEPMVPGEEGRKSIELIRAILKSEASGARATFPVKDMTAFPTIHNFNRDEPLVL